MSPVRSFALAALAATTLAVPALAQGSGSYYRAELAAPASKAQVVAGGVLWRCQDNQCVAAKDNSRPAIVCRRLARETAEVTRFTAAGEDISADDLARCNA